MVIQKHKPDATLKGDVNVARFGLATDEQKPLNLVCNSKDETFNQWRAKTGRGDQLVFSDIKITKLPKAQLFRVSQLKP